MKKKTIFLVFCMLIFSQDSYSYTGYNLPLGWRTPLENEVKQEWRNKDPQRFLVVRGDFNGDDSTDIARILIREKDKAIGLFAFVSKRVYELDVIADPILIECMGISIVNEGKYKTACGKGYYDCQKDTPQEIVIHHPSINYFKFESANSFFYWDGPRMGFKRVWISD